MDNEQPVEWPILWHWNVNGHFRRLMLPTLDEHERITGTEADPNPQGWKRVQALRRVWRANRRVT